MYIDFFWIYAFIIICLWKQILVVGAALLFIVAVIAVIAIPFIFLWLLCNHPEYNTIYGYMLASIIVFVIVGNIYYLFFPEEKEKEEI